MMSRFRILFFWAACAAVCLFSFPLFFFLGKMPSSGGRLWDGYRVLHVSGPVSESAVLSVLEESGCASVVSSSSSFVPVHFGDGYAVRRNAFFSDAEGGAMLFYIPDSDESCLPVAVSALCALDGVSAGTDGGGHGGYPAVPVVILLAAVLGALPFVRPRSVFLAASAFPVALVISRPFLSVALACAFSVICSAAVLRKLRRFDFAGALFRSVPALSAALLPFFILLISGAGNAVLYVVSVADSLACLYLFDSVRDMTLGFFPCRRRLAPVAAGRFAASAFLAAAFVCVVACTGGMDSGFGGFSFGISAPSVSSAPKIPAPVADGAGTELPCRDDFFAWRWSEASWPYRRLSALGSSGTEKAEDGDFVSVVDFEESPDGLIVPVERTVLSYDDDFRSSVSAEVMAAGDSLEKVILSQGERGFAFVPADSASGGEQFGLLSALLYLLIPLAFVVYHFVIVKKSGLKNGFSV